MEKASTLFDERRMRKKDTGIGGILKTRHKMEEVRTCVYV